MGHLDSFDTTWTRISETMLDPAVPAFWTITESPSICHDSCFNLRFLSDNRNLRSDAHRKRKTVRNLGHQFSILSKPVTSRIVMATSRGRNMTLGIARASSRMEVIRYLAP